ncbi:MAG TPA: ABC transporter substrate-binding protein [Myxococcaceae bacterium]|nr:ABC transporter substrate-binding protein [Myxococcaceae bacterium]
MAWRRKTGLYLFLALLVIAGGWLAASRLGLLDRASRRLFPVLESAGTLSPGDFPAGVTAPGGDIASVPLRPTLVGFTPRGSAAPLLLATGGVGEGQGKPAGLLRSSYSLDARAVVFARAVELRKALQDGAERGGVDMAALTVDRVASWIHPLRDAAPRVVLLLARSQGEDALGAVGVAGLPELKGRRLAVATAGPGQYFALWLLMRAGLGMRDVRWVDLPSALDAGLALREGRADAIVGLRGDVESAIADRGGKVLATTADAPHLIATVLVVRGEFAARYPDGVRRVIRGLLDAAAATLRDPVPAARLLGEVAPSLGDPREAVHVEPPATLRENLAFFGIAGQAPVTYDELFQSAAALEGRIGKSPPPPAAEDTRDVTVLRSLGEARP